MANNPLDDVPFETFDSNHKRMVKWAVIGAIGGFEILIGVPLGAIVGTMFGSEAGSEALDASSNAIYKALFNDQSTLNRDITWVLREALGNTLERIEREWKKHSRFLELGGKKDVYTSSLRRSLTNEQQSTLEFLRDFNTTIQLSFNEINLNSIGRDVLVNVYANPTQVRATLENQFVHIIEQTQLGLDPIFIDFVRTNIFNYWNEETWKIILSTDSRNQRAFNVYSILSNLAINEKLIPLAKKLDLHESQIQELSAITQGHSDWIKEQEEVDLSAEQKQKLKEIIEAGELREFSEDQDENLQYAKYLYQKGRYKDSRIFLEAVLETPHDYSQRITALEGLGSIAILEDDYLTAINLYTTIIRIALNMIDDHVYATTVEKEDEDDEEDFEEVVNSRKLSDDEMGLLFSKYRFARDILRFQVYEPFLAEAEDRYAGTNDYMTLIQTVERNLAVNRHLKEVLDEILEKWKVLLSVLEQGYNLTFLAEANPTFEAAMFLSEHANFSSSNANFEHAIFLSKKALELFRTCRNSESEVAKVTLDLGEISYNLGNYHEAISYLTECLPIFLSIGDRFCTGIVYQYLGQIEKDRNNMTVAKDHLQKSLQYYKDEDRALDLIDEVEQLLSEIDDTSSYEI